MSLYKYNLPLVDKYEQKSSAGCESLLYGLPACTGKMPVRQSGSFCLFALKCAQIKNVGLKRGLPSPQATKFLLIQYARTGMSVLRCNKIYLSVLILCLLIIPITKAQQIQIDRGVRVNDLWCFPLLSDSLTYLYLPDEASLALDKNKHPQFSLIRYVTNRASEQADNSTITQVGGGAVLHFLVQYHTPQQKIDLAATMLKKLLKNDAVKLQGPILFTSGNYALVSSILNPNTGNAERNLLAMGDAPVLEGSQIALSFELTPEQSKLLLESFKMQTPDISLVFDLTFEGLNDAFDATMTVNWSEVKKSWGMKAGGSYAFISAEVEAQIEELVRNNAIQLTTTGKNADMDAMIAKVYDKLMELLYQPVKPEEMIKQGGFTDALSALLNPKSGALSGGKTPGFSLYGGFQYKDIQSEGTTVLNFNSRSVTSRHHYITFNIGDFYEKFGSDAKHFQTVAMDDPDFQQREVYVGVDGALAGEFDKMINSVTVRLRKSHQSGDTTVKELIIRRNTLEALEPLHLTYGFRQDHNRTEWLNYQVQNVWQFQGGYGAYVSSWTDQSSAMINLFVPYERRKIQLSGDMEILKANGIKAIVAQVFYEFFGEKRKLQQVLRPGHTPEDFELIMPLNQYEYDYSIVWIKEGGTQLEKQGRDSLGLLFFDELPEEALTTTN
jgi:hypothetical protein